MIKLYGWSWRYAKAKEDIETIFELNFKRITIASNIDSPSPSPTSATSSALHQKYSRFVPQFTIFVL